MSKPPLDRHHELSFMIDDYIGVRTWQDAHMPIYGSFIGFDLILFLARSKFQSSPYSLKDVFHSLKYSEGSLRIFIRRLEKDGWIRLETWPGDRRNKKIIVHDNLLHIVENYFRQILPTAMPYTASHHDANRDIAST